MIDAKAFGEELAAIVKAATVPLISRIETLERAIAEQPAPKDGKDADPETVAEMVRQSIASDLDEIRAAIPDPQDVPDFAAMVAEAVKAIPAPKDGKDGIDGKDGERGPKGEAGRDGLDVKDLFRGEGGRLIAVMADGRTKDLGAFVGKDGADGVDGKDGRDGLGFDDLSFEEKDGRLHVVLRRGEAVKEARLPGLSYRGVWKAGDYLKGDTVTWGGSTFIALQDTSEKPETNGHWQLAVKRGRDGKDGVVKGERNAG